MDAKAMNMSAILSGEKQYVIPLFQRFYSWESSHWNKLWEDIQSLHEDIYVEHDSTKTHFFGSLVCTPLKITPDRIPSFMLIDGQQRLCTITTLLCAIRDIALENDRKEIAAEIEKKYLVDEFKHDIQRYKVIPRFKDRLIFLGLIDGKKNPAESLILHAYAFFKKELEQAVEDKGIEILTMFTNVVVKGLNMVVITIDDENPYEIFESLNATGLELSEADLIRNYVFMQVQLDEQEKFDTEKWLPFEDMFAKHNDYPPIDLTSFYRDYLMRNGDYVKKDETYIQFKKQFEASDKTIEQLIDELKHYAQFYCLFYRPTTTSDPEIALALKRYSFLDASTAYPLLLFLFDNYRAGTLSRNDWLSLLRSLESFLIRRSICGESTRGYGRLFPSVIKNISVNIKESILNFLKEKGWPTDERFLKALLDFELYKREDNKCRLILEELEKSFKHREPVDLTTQNIQIEHIMPQTLSEEWKEMLGNEWQRIFETYLHTIGNLTLSGYNQELYNNPFPEKKDRLARSNLELNKYFTNVDVWNEEAIKARGKTLADEIAKIWECPQL